MASNIIYISILSILAIFDIRKLIIPNWIVLPGIFLGVVLTGNWFWALLLFIIGAVFFNFDFFCGGDVKLISMVGAFLGHQAFFIVGIALILSICYYVNRNIRLKHAIDFSRPFTPFVLWSSLFFIWM